MKQTRKPTHPGGLFKRQFIERLGITKVEAAKKLGVSRAALFKFCNEEAACSKEMAKRLSIATGTSVELWLNMQNKLDIWTAERIKIRGVKCLEKIENPELLTEEK